MNTSTTTRTAESCLDNNIYMSINNNDNNMNNGNMNDYSMNENNTNESNINNSDINYSNINDNNNDDIINDSNIINNNQDVNLNDNNNNNNYNDNNDDDNNNNSNNRTTCRVRIYVLDLIRSPPLLLVFLFVSSLVAATILAVITRGKEGNCKPDLQLWLGITTIRSVINFLLKLYLVAIEKGYIIGNVIATIKVIEMIEIFGKFIVFISISLILQ